jgi:hypothetical protein
MSWKAIGQSVIGTSHVAVGKECEDAIAYEILNDRNGDEVLVCCASDGAGSAQYAGWASSFTVSEVVQFATQLIDRNEELTEGAIYAMLEDLYDGLEQEASAQCAELNEYSCTLLGCILTSGRSAFFQVGDGAIVRNDGSDFYTTIWWPHNGEYQNTTSFIVDDRTFSNVNILILEEPVDEIAMFTDGLQMLALSMEAQSVHQPFFTGLFKFLRMADDSQKIAVLHRKLGEYLDSTIINDRTDDDKTLFLATRIPA